MPCHEQLHCRQIKTHCVFDTWRSRFFRQLRCVLRARCAVQGLRCLVPCAWRARARHTPDRPHPRFACTSSPDPHTTAESSSAPAFPAPGSLRLCALLCWTRVSAYARTIGCNTHDVGRLSGARVFALERSGLSRRAALPRRCQRARAPLDSTLRLRDASGGELHEALARRVCRISRRRQGHSRAPSRASPFKAPD